jgi:hypothetical protein
MIRLLAIVLAVGALAAGAYQTYVWAGQKMQIQADMKRVGEPMAGEIDGCKQRLKAIHAAWSRYRKDHKGAEPASVDALLPKYVKSPEELVCPTAARLDKESRMVNRGVLTWEGEEHPVTYGFRWLTAGNAKAMKEQGENAPLVTCGVHHEAVGRYFFNRDPLEFAPSAGETAQLQKANVPWHLLTIQRDGDIVTEESL